MHQEGEGIRSAPDRPQLDVSPVALFSPVERRTS